MRMQQTSKHNTREQNHERIEVVWRERKRVRERDRDREREGERERERELPVDPLLHTSRKRSVVVMEHFLHSCC